MTSILLIEDDPLLGAMIREMLESREYEVNWVHSGISARRLVVQNYRPDVVLTDILMPDMDGLETIQFLHKACPEVPVIAMSAQAASGYLTLASRMGALAVLQKPFSQEVLFGTIQRLLIGRGPAGQAN